MNSLEIFMLALDIFYKRHLGLGNLIFSRCKSSRQSLVKDTKKASIFAARLKEDSLLN